MRKNELKLFILIVSKSVKERMKNKSNEMHVSKTMVAFKIRFTNIMKRYLLRMMIKPPYPVK